MPSVPYPLGTPLLQRHTTPIRVPGARLLVAMALPRVRRASRGRARPLAFELNLTSMIDYLVIVTVFLLTQFSASQDCCVASEMEYPSARNAGPIASAPIVSITPSAVLLDGTTVATRAAVQSSTDRIDPLFERLADARRVYPVLHPDEPFEGALVVQADRRTDWAALHRVLATASLAGYVAPSFVVNRAGPRDDATR
jgi:biopolymer transport protein ExbD